MSEQSRQKYQAFFWIETTENSVIIFFIIKKKKVLAVWQKRWSLSAEHSATLSSNQQQNNRPTSDFKVDFVLPAEVAAAEENDS